MHRRIGWLIVLGLLSGVGMAGCVSMSQRRGVELPLWKQPKPIVLFRGIRSGLSPTQVWRELCRRWTFGGRCEPLEPMSHASASRALGRKRLPLDLKLFSFMEKQGPLQCQHLFSFREWGLDAIRSFCNIEHMGQLKAVLREYKKKHGLPTQLYRKGQRRVMMWKDRHFQRRVMLMLLRRRGIIAIHKDLRMTWTQYIETLQPKLSQHSSIQWKRWRAIPLEVRNEVLTNFSQIIDKLGHFVEVKPIIELPSTQWGRALGGVCKARQLPPWSRKSGELVWRRLQFSPQRPQRLQYRWYVSPGSIYSRSFTLFARGCGYYFRLIIDQNGRNIRVQRLQVFRKKQIQK